METTTTTTTTQTETGIEITLGKFSVRIDQNDHEGRDFISTFGRYDLGGTFLVTPGFSSRSYKSTDRAERFAKGWLARKLVESAERRASLEIVGE